MYLVPKHLCLLAYKMGGLIYACRGVCLCYLYLLQLTTEEPWVFCWCMMLLTSHLLTVTSLFSLPVLVSAFGICITIAKFDKFIVFVV